MTALSLTFACALQVLAMGPGEVVRPERVAQLAADPQASAAATDRARARVGRLVAASRKASSEMATLRQTYDKQLAKIDKISAQRRSWGRDRQLRDQKAKSLRTAKALKTVQARLKKIRAWLVGARKELLSAVSLELKGPVTGSRRTGLLRLQESLRRSLRPKTRKIFLPDESFDKYDDPEELEEQMKLLLEADQELAQEERELAARAQRFARMDDLRRVNRRARGMEELDQDRVRRSSPSSGSKSSDPGSRDTGGGGASAGATADSDSAGPQSENEESGSPPPGDDFGSGFDGAGEPSPDPGGSLSESSIALAHVLDASTRDELQRADRSNDPGAKAKAAKRARSQVEARRKRLQKARQAIEAHLRRLRGK